MVRVAVDLNDRILADSREVGFLKVGFHPDVVGSDDREDWCAFLHKLAWLERDIGDDPGVKCADANQPNCRGLRPFCEGFLNKWMLTNLTAQITTETCQSAENFWRIAKIRCLVLLTLRRASSRRDCETTPRCRLTC